ncbi:MAG: dihydrofolate reductase family protein [Nocardioides sp.]
MRTLLGPEGELREVYAAPRTPWLRVNMVSTIDGAASGEDGVTGSINNEPDKRVFALLRELADVVVIGAGTVRAEGYTPMTKPLVVVSRSGHVPPTMRGAARGSVLMATVSVASGLQDARDQLGADNVLVLGSHRVDLAAMKQQLVDRGFGDQLCEGGPHLLRDLLDQRVADEVDCTYVPRIVAGLHPRITDGPPVEVPLTLHSLVEEDGTLLGRWFTG